MKTETFNPTTIMYLGTELHFLDEVDTCDEAQALLDFYRRTGRIAQCTHENDKHQVYVSDS